MWLYACVRRVSEWVSDVVPVGYLAMPPPPMHHTLQSLWKSEAWMSAPYSGGRMPTVRQYFRSTFKKGWG